MFLFFLQKNLALGENFLSPTLNIIQPLKEDQVSFVFEDFLCPCAGVLLFLPEKRIDKKEMEETLWKKSITFMSEGKR